MLPTSTAAPPNEVYELPLSVTEKLRLPKSVRLVRMGVHGEGSCAYHSICAALNIKDYVHKSNSEQLKIAHDFRCRFKDTFDQSEFKSILKTVPTSYKKTYNEVSEALCNPYAWADEVTIKYASKMLKANIIFLDIEANKFYCGVHDSRVLQEGKALESQRIDAPTIIVHWCNKSHFEPIGQIVKIGDNSTRLQLIFRPHKRKNDRMIVNSLMGAYSRECKQ